MNDLLIDPLTGGKLLYDNNSNTLSSSVSGNRYPVIGSIPQIIIDNNHIIAKSDIHSKYKSDFNYSDHYQKDAELFDYSEQDIPEIIKNEFERLHDSIVNEITNKISIVLDVGCGNGWASKKLIPIGKKVISMDISSTNPINAVSQLQHKNHAGLIADGYNIPIKENTIDCIIVSEVIEHVPDPRLFIINLINLLKDRRDTYYNYAI